MIAGALVSTFAKNWETYMAGRLVLGFGNSFAQMCSPILLTEICQVHGCLQLSLESGSPVRRLDCLGHFAGGQRVVMEVHHSSPGSALCHPAVLHLVGAGIA